jgi:hypothetical protein
MKGNDNWIRQRRADALRRLRGKVKAQDKRIVALIHELVRHQVDYRVEELHSFPRPKSAATTTFKALSAELEHRWIAEYVASRKTGQRGEMKGIVPDAAEEFGVEERTIYMACERNRHIVPQV